MSEPTYRIDTHHRPADGTPWRARVYQISDNEYIGCGMGQTKAQAVLDAAEMIRQVQLAEDTETLYATTTGQIVPAPEPQSLRA